MHAPDGHEQATEQGPAALAPTIVVIDAASFSSPRAREEMEGIFNKYPLKGEASSVKVGACLKMPCFGLRFCFPLKIGAEGVRNGS